MNKEELIEVLKKRFLENMYRHLNIDFEMIKEKLLNNQNLYEVVLKMEETGGEPDVVSGLFSNQLTFVDCSKESPIGRRSLCYDEQALAARKKDKPRSSAEKCAEEIGGTLLNFEQYCFMQSLFEFDLKTSSWILTDKELRNQKIAEFCENRCHKVYVYHNGAESYYSTRGFRVFVLINE